MRKASNKFAVILAGGVGSRFWPLSRELEPKQFLSLHGNKTLLQQTIERIIPLVPASQIYIISNRQYKFQIQRQIAGFSIPDANVILEPQGRNTAPAIGLAAKHICLSNPDAAMIVLPADHHISDNRKLLSILKYSLKLAQKNHLVAVGITPDMPHTGYGYIKVNFRSKIKGSGIDAYSARRFVEKPDKKLAEVYFKQKCYFWNSGIFVWKANIILEQIKTFLPEVSKMLQLIESSFNIDPKIWNKITPISIDYGVLEKAGDVVVVSGKGLGWSDLGSWSALSNIHPKDSSGNIIKGDCIDIESRNITVLGNSRLIATVGLKDVVLIDTDDALLVCNRGRTEEVKSVVERIKKENRQEFYSHKTVKRPWGSYAVINIGGGFKVKLVQIEPHKRLSLQFHRYRSEHWVVVEGQAKVTNCKKEYLVNENESIYIPQGGIHRLENPTDGPLKIIEVQCGQYLEEDDIERLSDDFNREQHEFSFPAASAVDDKQLFLKFT